MEPITLVWNRSGSWEEWIEYLFQHVHHKTIKVVTGPRGEFFHYFSWARTKQEMLVKTASWGHKNDRDWHSLIEKEFSHEFNSTDFVHGYSYNIVEDQFNLGI
jgi:hypothetical protein